MLPLLWEQFSSWTSGPATARGWRGAVAAPWRGRLCLNQSLRVSQELNLLGHPFQAAFVPRQPLLKARAGGTGLVVAVSSAGSSTAGLWAPVLWMEVTGWLRVSGQDAGR